MAAGACGGHCRYSTETYSSGYCPGLSPGSLRIVILSMVILLISTVNLRLFICLSNFVLTFVPLLEGSSPICCQFFLFFSVLATCVRKERGGRRIVGLSRFFSPLNLQLKASQFRDCDALKKSPIPPRKFLFLLFSFPHAVLLSFLGFFWVMQTHFLSLTLLLQVTKSTGCTLTSAPVS